MDLEALAIRFTTEGEAQLTGALGGIHSQIDGIAESAKRLFEAYLGYEAWKVVIEHAVETAVSLEKLSQKTGETVENLSRLRYAAKLSEVESGELDIGLKLLAKSMQAAHEGTGKNAAAFIAMGISVKDAKGEMRPMLDVLLDVADKFSTYQDGAAKSALALDIFGRSGTALVPVLNKGREGIRELMGESDKLGNTMSKQEKETLMKYEESIKRLSAVSEGLGRTMAVVLVPVLTKFIEGITDASHGSDNLVTAMDVVIGLTRSLAASFIALKYVAVTVFEFLRDGFVLVGNFIGNLAAIWSLMFSGQFDAASAAAKTWRKDMENNWDQMIGNLVINTQQAHDEIAAIFGFAETEANKPEPDKKKKQAPLIVDPNAAKEAAKAAAEAANKIFNAMYEAQWAMAGDDLQKKSDILKEWMDEEEMNHGIESAEYQKLLQKKAELDRDYQKSHEEFYKQGQDFDEETGRLEAAAFNARWQAMVGRAQMYSAMISNVIAETFKAAFSGKGIGGVFKAFGDAVLQSLGGLFVRIGETWITYGLIMLKWTAALFTPGGSGIAALAIGGALVALGSALGALGGSGGNGGGASGSYSGSSPATAMSTSIIFGQSSTTTAAGMTPRQPVSVTLIGPNDPVAQRQMLELIDKAQRRGG